jgi:hypothetical protein
MALTITDLDMMALRVTEQRPDRNIHEFDLTLWHLMSSLARKSPEKLKAQFSLPDAAITALANATEDKLTKLSSGVLISFQLKTNTQLILDKLQEKYTPILTLSDTPGSEFETAYWLLLKQISQRDYKIAAAAFGISADLTQAICNTTDNQLRNLIKVTSTVFTLRFSPKLLVNLLLTINTPTNARYFFKKYQQSISNIVKIGSKL